MNDTAQDRDLPRAPADSNAADSESATSALLTFELFAFRFRFRALESLYFPAGKAGNVIRGALGRIFRKFVCSPGCAGARNCPQRAVCAYARLFEPTAISEGPSGLGDWPRPFVIRAAHLDGKKFRPRESFYFDLNVFEMRDPALAYFAFSFSQLMREGLGPGRAGAELTAIHQFEVPGAPGAAATPGATSAADPASAAGGTGAVGTGRATSALRVAGAAARSNDAADSAGAFGAAGAVLGAQIFDGHTLADPRPLVLSLAPESGPVERVRVRFLTPTELKAEGRIVREPEFGALFARIRDRLHTLRSLYGAGPLPLDFSAAGERARTVKLTGSDLRWETSERRSGKTGQTHALGGFTGWAEYEGGLAEFIPYLRAASWTGVGRQTTWGKGHIEVLQNPRLAPDDQVL